MARLVSTRHYDGAILRSTEPLPARYRIEVTVANVSFGGPRDGRWAHGGKINGYDGDELADPWFFRETDSTPRSAITQNGLYFLCITDYARPAPHNNIFIHHHRKVVMDTDNNEYGPEPGAAVHGSWSKAWDPRTAHDEVRRYGGAEVHTWPRGSAYPDHFFLGDPHINFYEGTAEFDDLDLYLPAPEPAPGPAPARAGR